MKCEECVYYEYMKTMLQGCGNIWGGSQPHPCTYCKHFPTDRKEYPDNFRPATSGTVTSSGTAIVGGGGDK